MSLFYVKGDEIFIPEAINPELIHLAKAIVKTCRLTFKVQMKTTSLKNAVNAGKPEQMLDAMQKCMEKNRRLYDSDMALAGVTIGTVDESFFADKDADFFKNQLNILIDFAYINSVIEAKMFPLLSAACEKTLGKKINTLYFFTNQTEILKSQEEEKEETAEEAGETE